MREQRTKVTLSAKQAFGEWCRNNLMLDLLPRHLELVRSKPCAVSSRLSLGLLSLPLLTLPLNVAPYHLDQSVSHVNALKSTGSLKDVTDISRQPQVNGAHAFSHGVALEIAALASSAFAALIQAGLYRWGILPELPA